MMDSSWKPIPNYDGLYWINSEGAVCNSSGHIIKPIMSKSGLRVELRKFGQRETVPVEYLMNLTEYAYETI